MLLLLEQRMQLRVSEGGERNTLLVHSGGAVVGMLRLFASCTVRERRHELIVRGVLHYWTEPPALVRLLEQHGLLLTARRGAPCARCGAAETDEDFRCGLCRAESGGAVRGSYCSDACREADRAAHMASAHDRVHRVWTFSAEPPRRGRDWRRPA